LKSSISILNRQILEPASFQTIVVIFFKLLLAHLVADFLFQPKKWIADRKKKKYKSGYLYFHVLIVMILTWLFLGEPTEWQIPAFIGITHLLIDIWKSYRPDNFVAFLADQFAHIMILVIATAFFASTNLEFESLMVIEIDSLYFWTLLTAFFLVTYPSAYFVSAATGRWRKEMSNALTEEPNAGLDSAGKWIGIVERILILLFIVMNQFGAVGFLIAAKSVFRFGSISNPDDQMRAEYILIGTLISFAIAIATGVFVTLLT